MRFSRNISLWMRRWCATQVLGGRALRFGHAWLLAVGAVVALSATPAPVIAQVGNARITIGDWDYDSAGNRLCLPVSWRYDSGRGVASVNLRVLSYDTGDRVIESRVLRDERTHHGNECTEFTRSLLGKKQRVDVERSDCDVLHNPRYEQSFDVCGLWTPGGHGAHVDVELRLGTWEEDQIEDINHSAGTRSEYDRFLNQIGAKKAGPKYFLYTPDAVSSLSVTPPTSGDHCTYLDWAYSFGAWNSRPAHFSVDEYSILVNDHNADRLGQVIYDPTDGNTGYLRYCDRDYWKIATDYVTYSVAGRNSLARWFPNQILRYRTIAVLREEPAAPDPGRLTFIRSGAPQPVGLSAELSVVELSDPEVVLTWDATLDANDQPVFGYNLWYRNQSDSDSAMEPRVLDLVTNRHALEFSEVGEYQLRVQAYNSDFGSPLSPPITIEVLPAPDRLTSDTSGNVRLSDFSGAELSISGPTMIPTGATSEFVHQTTANTDANCDATAGEVCTRYGGDQRGFGFDAGADATARWVAADNLANCTGVTFCVLRPSGADYSVWPDDGTASRWLAYWRGTDTSTGFEGGEAIRVYVPSSVTADTSFEIGLAQVPDMGDPQWLTGSGSDVTHRTIDVVVDTQPTAVTAEFTDQYRLRLAWTMPEDAPHVRFRVERKLGTSPTDPFSQVGKDRAAVVRQVIDTISSATATYSYRVGAVFPGGYVGWSDVVTADASTQAVAGVTPVTFDAQYQNLELYFARSAPVDHALPTAVGGNGTLRYSTNSIAAVGLSFDSANHKLTGTAVPGSASLTLTAEDQASGVGYLGISVFVGDTPDPPVDLTAVGGVRQVRLQWSAPLDVSADEVIGYRVERSANGMDGWTPLVTHASPAVTSYVDTDLANQQTAHYRVAAVNRDGYGLFSSVQQATTAMLSAPGAPANLIARGGRQRIDLEWQTPDHGGADFVGYKIEHSATGGTDDWAELVANTGSAAKTYAHTGLRGSQRVYYRVSAITSFNLTTDASLPASAITDPVTLPEAPAGLAVQAAVGRADLSWNSPEFDGGADIIGYQVEYRRNLLSDPWLVLASAVAASDRTYTHAILRAERTRRYRVAAINVVGMGPYSEVVTIDSPRTTNPPAPLPQPIVTAGPGTLSGHVIMPVPSEGNYAYSFSGFSVEYWRDMAGEDHVAILDRSCFDAQGNELDLTRDGRFVTVCTFHTTELEPRDYWVAVSAEQRNESGTHWSMPTSVGPVTVPAVGMNVPAIPTFLRAESGDRQVTVAWRMVEGATSFDLERLENGAWRRLQASSITLPAAGEEVSRTLTGLAAGETAILRVIAVNDLDDEDAQNDVRSGPSMVFRVAASAGAPDAPTNITVTSVPGSDDVVVAWMPPASDGGAEISEYEVQVSSSRVNWDSAVTARVGEELNHYLVRDRPAVTEYYRVLAVNEHGLGPPSNPPVQHRNVAASVPGRPLSLQTTTVAGQTDVVLQWLTPRTKGGQALTAYRIESSATGRPGSWTPLYTTPDAATRTHTHAGLTVAQTVYYRVFASNDEGEGLPSVPAVAYVGEVAPAAPTGLTAAGGQVSVALTWVAPADTGGSDIIGYRVEHSADASAEWRELVANSGTASLSYVHADAGSVRNVRYRVAAINRVGVGAWSAEVTATTVSALPGRPTNLTVQTVGRNVHLVWDAPADTGRSGIVGYQIERTADVATAWTVVTENTQSATTEFTDTPMITTGETTLYYRVAARNSSRTRLGIASDSVRATIVIAVPPPPPSMTLVAARGGFTVAWESAADALAEPVTGYVVQTSPMGFGDVWTEAHRATASDTSYTHSIAESRTTRQVRVAATNLAGVGRFTRPQEVTTLSYGPLLDVNDSGGFNHRDALIAYYALEFDGVLGTGTATSGFADMRLVMLEDLAAQISPADDLLRRMLSAVHQAVPNIGSTPFDLDGDGTFDGDDALGIYYGLAWRTTLGDGTDAAAGDAEMRRMMLAPFAPQDDPTDSDLLQLLRNINGLP